MAKTAYARPEQTQSLVEISPFDAGVQAAHAWFVQPKASAATHRDSARCAFVRGFSNESEVALVSHAFNRGFERGLALAMSNQALKIPNAQKAQLITSVKQLDCEVMA